MRDYAEHWSTSALCAQIDADIWFPVKGGIGSTRAKRICMACPVRIECLASVGPEDVGIWGGLSDRQRRMPGRTRGRTRTA